MTLGEFIKQRRNELGIQQKELAEKLGISPQYMNDIEKGNRTPTDYDFLLKIAQEIHRNEDYLCFLAGILPKDITEMDVPIGQVAWAFTCLRQALSK